MARRWAAEGADVYEGASAPDIRALVGASTPHFSLQVRNRIRRLIAPLPPGHPARVEGERKIAQLEDLGAGPELGRDHHLAPAFW